MGFFAARGVAAMRIDLRGSGNSDGLLRDEYLAQEQDDAVEVIAWIARQAWCNVGIIGISWGGFAALQIAARRPPALKAIITCCSTDDRYSDDVITLDDSAFDPLRSAPLHPYEMVTPEVTRRQMVWDVGAGIPPGGDGRAAPAYAYWLIMLLQRGA